MINNYRSQKNLRKIYGNERYQSQDFLGRKQSIQTDTNIYGLKPINLKKVEIKFEKQEQYIFQYNTDEKSRLIENENKQMIQLPTVWMYVQKDFELKQVIGSGSFGTVVKATHRKSGSVYAIKHIAGAFADQYSTKTILREITILKQFSQMKNNLFTPKLFQIIVPGLNKENIRAYLQKKQLRGSISKTTMKDYDKLFFEKKCHDRHKSFNKFTKIAYPQILSNFMIQDSNNKIKKIEDIFIIQEHFEMDLRKLMMSAAKVIDIQERHIITLLYNSLCALNFIHSANIIHRDIKPSNILVDNLCQVKICDFGMSRSMLSFSQSQSIFSDIKNQYFKMNHLQYNLINSQFRFTFHNNQDLKFISRDFQNQDECQIRYFISKKLSRELEKQKNQKDERSFTPEVQTRWYRAPEVILMEKIYDQSVDIWSLGCSLAELIHCQEQYVYKKRNIPLHLSKRFLFQGQACHPISPIQTDDQDNQQYLKSNDQLQIILNGYGKLSSSDKSFISNDFQLEYLESFKISQYKNIDQLLGQKFPKTSKEIIDILRQMLEFNPIFRPSAEVLLKNQIFDKIRIPALENVSKSKIFIKYDSTMRQSDEEFYNFLLKQ